MLSALNSQMRWDELFFSMNIYQILDAFKTLSRPLLDSQEEFSSNVLAEVTRYNSDNVSIYAAAHSVEISLTFRSLTLSSMSFL